jgi:hypothetical protein
MTLPFLLPAQQTQQPSMTANEIVQRMTERNQERALSLQHFTSTRHYRLEYRGFPADKTASMEVEAEFDAPASRSFRVISQTGSKLLIDRVLKKLLEGESDATRHQHSTDLNLANYKFELKGTETDSTGRYYVLGVEPRIENKYLYRGRVWVDADDFALARIDAQPAVNPSFMIRKTEIHHLYTKVGDFWLPLENRTVSRIRLGGVATLSIDYGGYKLVDISEKNASKSEAERATGR